MKRRMTDDGPPMIAVPKGALYDDVMACLDAVGYDAAAVRANERRQLFEQERVMTMRPSDVVAYVAEGVADLGIVGKDVIAESLLSPNIYELADLRFGRCRMSLATLAGNDNPVDLAIRETGVARIGTKYPRTALRWAEATSRSIDIIELKGSVELAAVSGLAHGIVDLVDTGNTLRENGLVERTEIAASTARLIANPVSYIQHADTIARLADQLEQASAALA
jgi:ATP phosphoribosyltransferase